MPRVLLLIPTTSYRTADFVDAARALGAEVTVAAEEPSTLEALNPAGFLTLDFRDPEECARRAAEFARSHPVHAVVGVDDETSVAAASIAAALGLRHNSSSAAAAARHKGRMREAFYAAGVPSPEHRLFRVADGPLAAAAAVRFPCVLKPTFLAASRGVIRADDAEQFRRAWDRIAAILAEPDVARRGGPAAREILVEDFVSGREVAVEGLLTEGRLRILALFDKPDALEGPFFEETIYVTPSRLPSAEQERIAAVTSRAAAALGLTEGPIHAELRVNAEGPWPIEVAARSIGGLCSRALRFGTGMSLEELILRHALGQGVEGFERSKPAAGVMMIPIPSGGRLDAVGGEDEARAVPGIAEVTISAHPGQVLVPLPEGSRYLGFLFASARTPQEAEAALRAAHARLVFLIVPQESAGGRRR